MVVKLLEGALKTDLRAPGLPAGFNEAEVSTNRPGRGPKFSRTDMTLR
jgi:hypothetical protein